MSKIEFEPFNPKMGTVPCQIDDQWYVVQPDGKAEKAVNECEARFKAAYKNLSVEDYRPKFPWR